MRLVEHAGAGRADTMSEFMDAASSLDASPERLFRTVSGELERTLWQVLMRPTSDAIHVLQLGAVVELMPNVYLQAVRLMYHKPFDRYVRLWCIVPAANGIETSASSAIVDAGWFVIASVFCPRNRASSRAAATRRMRTRRSVRPISTCRRTPLRRT